MGFLTLILILLVIVAIIFFLGMHFASPDEARGNFTAGLDIADELVVDDVVPAARDVSDKTWGFVESLFGKD